ncbi:DUF6651 domain-containing protein [Pararhizobium qamdonense]|uniref:DUF6651 domain-containing protein n=1 Tax=Pararhizobium qamdonense TaxID=3031126 RepID=UPI0023E15B08|nr:DUF6651 domain-containing protein [Pararhizobium qamdonense]
MTKTLMTALRATAAMGAFAAAPMYPGAPRIAFQTPDENGTGKTAEELAAEAAAAAEAAKKTPPVKTAEELAAEEEAAAAAAATNKTDDKDKGLLAEVMAKKNRIKELEATVAKFDGIDPDAVRALLEEKRTAELAAQEAAGNFTRVKEMMAEQHSAATKTLTDQIADLQKQLAGKDSTINELTVGRRFSESKFIGEDLVLPRAKARAIYSAHFEVVDGNIVGYDKPAGAKDRTQLIDAAGKPVDFEDAIKRIIDADPEKDSLYRDKSKAGAGSSSAKVEAPKTQEKDRGLYGVSRILAGMEKGK